MWNHVLGKYIIIKSSFIFNNYKKVGEIIMHDLTLFP